MVQNTTERDTPQRKGHSNTLRRLTIILAIVLGLGITTYAVVHYSQQKTVENTMSTVSSEVLIQELFNPSDQWVPGETKDKKVFFANSGETQQVIRFWFTEEWTDSEGNPFDGAEAAIIDWTEALGSQWMKIGEYYYYLYVLEPGVSTDDLMTSVTFSSTINNGSYAQNAVDYSDKIYNLTIFMQALPVNGEVTAQEWSVTFDQTEPVISWNAVP